MNLGLSNYYPNINFKSQKLEVKSAPERKIEDRPIITRPAQLSLLHAHDFHGQSVRMERAQTVIQSFDSGKLQPHIFAKSKLPTDRLKLCSGDMFIGSSKKDLEVVNKFLNLAGFLAITLGNHECDSTLDDFSEIVKNRSYRILGSNMHPDKESKMNRILSDSFVVESNGNRYGIIGLVPVDMPKHLKYPEKVEEFNISGAKQTLEDLKGEIQELKDKKVNKIILLSHLGLKAEQYIAQNVSDIDIILGGHTHDLMTKLEKGKNLFKSPKGEPVLIMQVGRDGEFIGLPNVKFNEYGQITEIQYNLVRTDDFARNLKAKTDFEAIIGKPETVGEISYVEDSPSDIYAKENPTCDFIADCMRKELGTDLAFLNSSIARGNFQEGIIDTRDIKLITPLANKMVVIEATEKEIVDALNKLVKTSMQSPNHRPGIMQVSGLRYEYSQTQGKVTKITFIDKNGKAHNIDVKKPRTDRIYTIATDDYCAKSPESGLGLEYRLQQAKKKFDYDKDVFVASYLKKQLKPVEIKTDGRIKVVD